MRNAGGEGFEALVDSARRRAGELQSGDRRDREAAPGDLFVLPESAEFAVEWLLVSVSTDRGYRVVPVDTHPAHGKDDVVVGDASSVTGPLTARCAHALRLPGSWFEVDRRTGSISDLSEVAIAIDAAPSPPSLDGVEAELRCWLEDTVLPATEVVAAAAGADALDAPGPQDVHPDHAVGATVPWRSVQMWQLVAASLLVVNVVLAMVLLRDAAPSRAGSSLVEPMVNLPILWLGADQVLRSPPSSARVRSSATHWLLIVETPGSHPEYQLTIVERDSTREVWSADQLEVTGLIELAILVPRSSMPPGNYRVHLAGIRDGQTEALSEQALTIEGTDTFR